MQDIRDLLPQWKLDTAKARALVELGYPAVAPVLPELVAWLQDINWPVAHVLAPFLATIGLPLLPEIRRVLDTDDDFWKQWVLICLVKPSAELTLAIREDLVRMATAPRRDEALSELDVLAQEILSELPGEPPGA